jgi:hypothetical protein
MQFVMKEGQTQESWAAQLPRAESPFGWARNAWRKSLLFASNVDDFDARAQELVPQSTAVL